MAEEKERSVLAILSNLIITLAIIGFGAFLYQGVREDQIEASANRMRLLDAQAKIDAEASECDDKCGARDSWVLEKVCHCQTLKGWEIAPEIIKESTKGK